MASGLLSRLNNLFGGNYTGVGPSGIGRSVRPEAAAFRIPGTKDRFVYTTRSLGELLASRIGLSSVSENSTLGYA
ncbi:MAG: hypothetical protein MK033_08085 [Candidatus Caenarcaniphilales bacterium]|nr:hypothetical protein [Candidatus Caenarcaniphilales bacterium]